MKNRNIIFGVIHFLIVFIVCGFLTASAKTEITIAMCRPSTGQIENIIVLKKMKLITLDDFKLLCIYHEDELTDYDESKKFVTERKIDWIEFVKISGRTDLINLFRENIWTSQFRSIFNNSNGIIFTGGMDIPPRIYGEENSLLTEATTPVRTYYEVSFLFHLIGSSKNPGFIPFLEHRKNYPVLGICLGSQTMNIAAGGSLIQDIPSEIYGLKTVEEILRSSPEMIHSSRYAKLMDPVDKESISPAFHKIRVSKNSLLIKSFFLSDKEKPYVLSSHHQALKKLGSGLFVSARSMDGKVIEAVEHFKYKNVLGVQFHPEFRELYYGNKLYKKIPGRKGYYILKDFVREMKGTSEFHKRLWRWFGRSTSYCKK